MNIPESHMELLLAYIEAIEATDRIYEENVKLKKELVELQGVVYQYEEVLTGLTKKQGGCL